MPRIHEAVRALDLEAVRELLSSAPGSRWAGALAALARRFASLRGEEERSRAFAIARLILERGGDPSRLLREAVRSGAWELAELSLERGADPKAAEEGLSAPILDEVVERCPVGLRLRLARALLERGAEPSPTALALAAERPGEDSGALLSLLLPKGHKALERRVVVRFLEASLLKGEVRAFRSALSAFPQYANEVGAESGKLLLYLAAGLPNPGKSLEATRALLEAGADPRMADAEGATALHGALWPGVVGLLLDAGAHLEARDGEGATPLMRACGRGLPGAVKALLDRGADAGAKDLGGNGAFHHLALGTEGNGKRPRPLYPRVARLLAERGANPVERNRWGMTPLHVASMSDGDCAAKVRAVLLACRELGVDPEVNALDGTGKGAIHYLALSPCPSKAEALRHFLEAGGDPYLRREDGKTALDLVRLKVELRLSPGRPDYEFAALLLEAMGSLEGRDAAWLLADL